MAFAKTIQSTCAYCGVGCGVDINVENSLKNEAGESHYQAVSLAATPEHPANFGRLCIKGKNLLETTGLSGRLLEPKINDETVSWSKATSYVAQQFNETIAKYGPDSVAFYVSGQLLTEDYYVANKLMKGYIGSANIDTNSRLCMSSAVSAYKRAFGEDIVPCSYQDLEKTDVLFISGSNMAWTHPVLFQRIERAKAINPNFKVVVIDPRKTATSSLADIFLPIKPGTDGAFFNGLLAFIADQEYIDRSYIEQYTQGFDDALEQANKWPLEKVADYCQLPLALLTQTYQLFCQSEKAVTFFSMGINQSSSGVDKCNSIINCHLATGKLAKEGCGPFSITGQPNAMGGREVGGLANQLAAHMDIDDVAHQDIVQRFWQSPTIANKQGKKAVDLFDAIERGEIKAVWIMATNPMVSLPNSDKIAKALTKCPLVVVSDCVENNDTLAYAQVKLPATPWLEKDGTVTNSERRISRQRAAISPNGSAKHDWQIMCDVAKKMGFSGFDYRQVHQIFNEHAALSGFENYQSINKNSKRLFDISALAQLNKADYDNLSPIQWPVNANHPQGFERVLSDGKFFTVNGKANFIAIQPQAPKQVVTKPFPFLLNSGRIRDHWHTMTRTAQTSILSQHTDKPFISLHANDAQALNITETDIVKISSLTGEVTVPVNIDDTVKVGECFIPIHWNKQYASSAVVNCLYPAITDPLSGQVESKQTAVSIEKENYQHSISLHLSKEVNTDLSKEFTKALSDDDFWLKNNNSHGFSYQLGLKEAVTDPRYWCQQLTGIEGEWLQFIDNEQGDHFIICLQQNKLVCLAHIGQEMAPLEISWLTHVFKQENLAFAEIQSLLLGQSSEQFNQGKQVCSCFNIGEKTIKSAIEQGCDSVIKLGEKLNCGTNCGSCKSELQTMVDQVAINSAQLIPATNI